MRPVRIKRRGVTVDGKRLRELRQLRGLTQDELARVAGIAERTVRSAEAGLRIRVDFLRFLATSLGIETVDLVADRSELRVFAAEDKQVNSLLQAIHGYAFENDLSGYHRLMSPSILLRLPGPESIPFVGEYRGLDGLRLLYERAQATVVHEDAIDISDIRTGGNLVVMQFTDSARIISTGKKFRGYCQYVYEFDKGRIMRVDNFFDSGAVLEAMTQ